MNRREFMKGLVAIGGLLGIGAKVVAQEPVGTGMILEVTDEPIDPDGSVLHLDSLECFDNVSGPWVDVPGPYKRMLLVSEDCVVEWTYDGHHGVEVMKC